MTWLERFIRSSHACTRVLGELGKQRQDEGCASSEGAMPLDRPQRVRDNLVGSRPDEQPGGVALL